MASSQNINSSTYANTHSKAARSKPLNGNCCSAVQESEVDRSSDNIGNCEGKHTYAENGNGIAIERQHALSPQTSHDSRGALQNDNCKRDHKHVESGNGSERVPICREYAVSRPKPQASQDSRSNGKGEHNYVVNGNCSERENVGPLPQKRGEWKRIVCSGSESAAPRQHVWLTRDGFRVNFRGNTFTVPTDVQLAASCDTSYGDLLEFHLTGESSRDPLGLLQKLRCRYTNPHSSLYNQSLKFDIADDRLYVAMPSGIASDFAGQLVIPQLHNYQSRVAHRFPNQPNLVMSGSSGLVDCDGAPTRLCGDGSIVDEQELQQKTLEVHALKRAVPKNLKVYVNFETISFTDNKDALIRKCRDQVQTGQALVAVALCDRADDGEVLIFRRSDTQIMVDRCFSPRFIDLGDVIPLFRVYLSYGMNMYFQAHHEHNMKGLSQEKLLCLLCDSILEEDLEMAKEAINGLASLNSLDRFGRSSMVCAAARGHLEMVEYLFDNGAEIDSTDHDGVSPLLAAKAAGHDNTSNFFVSRGVVIELSGGALVDVIDRSELKRLELLLQAGVDPDERDAKGMTSLMHASSKDAVHAVELLLQAGVDPDERDAKGMTPLMHASLEDAAHAIHRLLRAGASKSLCDSRGRTAKDFADFMNYSNISNMLDAS